MKKDWNAIFRAKWPDFAKFLEQYCGYRAVREGGGQIAMWCPHHHDSQGNRNGENCHVNNDKAVWYCYSCENEGQPIFTGSYVQAIMQAMNMSKEEAFKFLVHECGEDIGDVKRTVVEVRRAFAMACFKLFWERINTDHRYNAAARYVGGRGFILKTVRKFQLGFSTGDELKLLYKQGISKQELLDAGILRVSKRTGKMYNAFRNRIVMVVGANLYGRAIDQKNTLRHLYTTSANELFNARSAEAVRRDIIFVVEAAFDALTIDQYISRLGANWAVVATCGTHGVKDIELAKQLKKFNATEIVFVPDCDPWVKDGRDFAVGQKSVLKKAKVFEENGIHTRILVLPDNSDPNDLSKNSVGAGKFKEMVNQALPVVSYEVFMTSHFYDLTQVGARESFLQKCKEIVASNHVGLTSDIVAQVAELVGKTEEEVFSFLSGSFMKSAVMQYFGICHRHGMTDEEIVKHISKLFAKENAKKE